MGRKKKNAWLDRFLVRHPNFPMAISVAALAASFRREIGWLIDWIASRPWR